MIDRLINKYSQHLSIILGHIGVILRPLTIPGTWDHSLTFLGRFTPLFPHISSIALFYLKLTFDNGDFSFISN